MTKEIKNHNLRYFSPCEECNERIPCGINDCPKLCDKCTWITRNQRPKVNETVRSSKQSNLKKILKQSLNHSKDMSGYLDNTHAYKKNEAIILMLEDAIKHIEDE